MSLICIFLVAHFLNFSKYAKIAIKNKNKNEELVMLLKLIYFELV